MYVDVFLHKNACLSLILLVFLVQSISLESCRAANILCVFTLCSGSDNCKVPFDATGALSTLVTPCTCFDSVQVAGTISAYGFIWGYTGGLLCTVLTIPVAFAFSDEVDAYRVNITLAGVWCVCISGVTSLLISCQIVLYLVSDRCGRDADLYTAKTVVLLGLVSCFPEEFKSVVTARSGPERLNACGTEKSLPCVTKKSVPCVTTLGCKWLNWRGIKCEVSG